MERFALLIEKFSLLKVDKKETRILPSVEAGGGREGGRERGVIGSEKKTPAD